MAKTKEQKARMESEEPFSKSETEEQALEGVFEGTGETALVEVKKVRGGITRMDKEEARERTDRVRSSMENIAVEMDAIRKGHGYKALGYKTMTDYIRAEFLSQARSVYRALADLEQKKIAAANPAASFKITIPRTHRAVLDKVPGEDTHSKAENEAKVYDLAKELAHDEQYKPLGKAGEHWKKGQVTAQVVRVAAERLFPGSLCHSEGGVDNQAADMPPGPADTPEVIVERGIKHKDVTHVWFETGKQEVVVTVKETGGVLKQVWFNLSVLKPWGIGLPEDHATDEQEDSPPDWLDAKAEGAEELVGV